MICLFFTFPNLQLAVFQLVHSHFSIRWFTFESHESRHIAMFGLSRPRWRTWSHFFRLHFFRISPRESSTRFGRGERKRVTRKNRAEGHGREVCGDLSPGAPQESCGSRWWKQWTAWRWLVRLWCRMLPIIYPHINIVTPCLILDVIASCLYFQIP
jgi:hypothetical protein